MIPVRQAPEPAYFDVEVRQPGRAFLDNHPDRELKTLWDIARDDLRRSYERICAYTCQRIVDGTIDHFLPKSKFRALAYEWSNYRLCSNAANQAKADRVGLVDPFKVGRFWFAIAFPQCDVVLGQNVPDAMHAEARFTIDALRLNSEDLVEDRAKMALQFCDGEVTLAHVQKYRPFLAVEIERQGTAKGPTDEAGFRLFVAGLFRRRKSGPAGRTEPALGA